MKLDYNEENLKRVSEIIKDNLTIDLLPLNMRQRNIFGGSNNTYGHCHTASGVLYHLFGSKNVTPYKALDEEGLYHWWVVDKNGKIIDITSEQYTLLNRTPPYDQGKKASLLGFDYRKKVKVLLERVEKALTNE